MTAAFRVGFVFAQYVVLQKHAGLCYKATAAAPKMPFLGVFCISLRFYKTSWCVVFLVITCMVDRPIGWLAAGARTAEWKRRAGLNTIGLLFTWTAASHTHIHGAVTLIKEKYSACCGYF